MASSSSATWRPKQQGQIPTASQGKAPAESQGLPERGEPSRSHLLMATYNIGAPEDMSHTSKAKQDGFTTKLVGF